MSRIGKQPVEIPAGVEISINGQEIKVKGKLGELSRSVHPAISVEREGEALLVKRPDDSKSSKALHGLTRSLINNMVVGVSEGFSKTLLIEGVGYRCMAKGQSFEFSLGYSHPIIIDPPEGITFESPKPTELTIRGVNKEAVGQVAANIRALRKPEPYKGKGIRYANERIVRKAGKAAAAK